MTTQTLEAGNAARQAEVSADQARGWSIATFAEFWSAPSASLAHIPSLLADDIVGYWPAGARPARGARSYWQYIVELLKLAPALRVHVKGYAVSGELHFVLWEASGLDPDGSRAVSGCDCVRVREGTVLENRIFCEHPLFAALAARIATLSA